MENKMSSIPLPLKQALELGECVLFVGAGVGKHLTGNDSKPLLNGGELAAEMALKYGISLDGCAPNLMKVAEVVEIRRGRSELDSFLQKKFSNVEPDNVFQWIASQKWRAIFTTNYDNGIERAYGISSTHTQNPIAISATSQMTHVDFRCEVPIYHLHGAAFGESVPKFVITDKDYTTYKAQREMLFDVLKTEFATSPILYVGYANEDSNWNRLLSEVEEDFYPSKVPQSYRISPKTNPMDVEILESRGVKTINCDFKEFVDVATVELEAVKEDAVKYSKLQQSVPRDLIEAFLKNKAPVLRMLGSWTYVNRVSFSDKSNLSAFLRGDKAHWPTIASKEYFERDIEDQVYDAVLDYVTGAPKKPTVVALLGPAGYGTSTLLMSLAARIVKDQAGKVFSHKAGSPLNEGDVRYAASLFPGIPVFVVDDAADNSSNIQLAIQLLSNEGRPALFLLGERLNEWRQNHKKIRAREYLLESLSEGEINRLLDLLTKHRELGVLEHVPRDLQFSAIKSKCNKELLVAMREATEGNGFDAILEGEFRGIDNDFSRKMYLMVCCFYQYGIVVRDSLLAELMGVSVPELYEKSGDSTEGVVVFDELGGMDGRYCARARHRTIASVVWERCGHQSEKVPLIQSAMSALNLAYKSDRDAYEAFYKSDNLVDSLNGLEEKTKYFELACRKDPGSPYVRQHYARMLSRSNKPNLALAQIEDALALSPRARMLHHTKGVVLAQLMQESDSLDVARKRLAQSEAAFKTGLSISPNDEYCLHGLASLYFNWAKRPIVSEESSDYLAKAEEVIANGLKIAYRKEPLWLISADISNWIGNSDANILALEQAVAGNPTSVISRYLLGCAYRRKGLPAKTIEVLHPVLKEHAEEFRVFLEYAIALRDLGKTYKEMIGILEIARTYGLSNPRYIATLGGLLFLDRNFDEAKKVFLETDKRYFAGDERLKIYYQDTSLMVGTVATIRAGSVWVQSGDLPRIYCPSRLARITLHEGMRIKFQLGFNSIGPVVQNIS